MAVEVFVAFFGFSSSQLSVSEIREADGDKRTVTIIAPVHDAIKVIERKSERLGCREFVEAALSSTSLIWAMMRVEGGGEREKRRRSPRVFLTWIFFSVSSETLCFSLGVLCTHFTHFTLYIAVLIIILGRTDHGPSDKQVQTSYY